MPDNSKKYLVVTVILFFVGVAMLFGAAKFFIKKTGMPLDENIQTEIREEKSNLNINPGPEIKIQPQTEIKFPLIKYKNGEFNPKELNVTPDDATQICLITILNEDAGDLILRLSPYSQEDKIGFKYDPISSGKSLTIDPRYGEMTELTFHNRKIPEAEFQIILDQKCF